MSVSDTRAPVTGAIIVLAGGLGGLAVSIYNYVTPLTGITGTPGAMLVIVSCALLVLDAILLMALSGHGARAFWRVLGFLGVFGTIAAAVFLHAWWLIAAMVVVFIGLVADAMLSAPTSKGVIA
ncbi:hypothetical protein AQS8620_02171 [Aquimixticola soesokkakensis]|uniref:Uncharacterized protein n=1 Tax=Aquimixticola soesokkakensis TaxID=1519096 RepID=A0A1Y5SZX2_9RHOB|nr:hypothetical protein [Aquimixticola soesokkakensis]SLN50415.1 hypothetical protein AQS8620_02171 [Aquimixticola soesokkakensis]